MMAPIGDQLIGSIANPYNSKAWDSNHSWKLRTLQRGADDKMNRDRKMSHRIRLLHLVNRLGVGGAEVLLLHYINALGTEEYDHYVYYFGADGPIRQKIEGLGIPVHMGKNRDSIKHPIRFGMSLIFLIKDLLSFIRSKRIQIIQSHLGQANQIAVAVGKLAMVPAFPTVHSTMPFLDTRGCWDPRVHLVKIVNAFTYRSADSVLAVSQKIKSIIRQMYGLENSKLLVLKNGILVENTLSNCADIEKEFPESAGKLKLIALGRLVPLKCFDVLVRAAAEVVKQGLHNLLVLIAGDGRERSRLTDLIRDLDLENHVKLLGLRHDVMDLMQACDLFVLPSRYEGLSIAMIEAMACGLPIIASDAPGLRDHIKTEQNGLLFPVENHKALAERILQLANDKELRYSLSCGAKRSFEREYDMRENIKPLDILFRKCAADS